jgi:parallel beta-helix repeat protein
MVTQRRFLSLGFKLSVMLLLLVAANPTWAGVECGDEIGPNEVAILTHDLTCSSDDPALTLVGPKAVLNMAGHTVTCEKDVVVGIYLDGSGAILKGGLLQHGTVTGCVNGVVLEGDGHHRVTKVTSTRNELYGFAISSFDNEVKGTTSLGNDAGYTIDGDRHILKGNLAKGNINGFVGLKVNDTLMTANRAVENTGNVGFEIEGNGNHLRRNLAKDNRGTGFFLKGNEVRVLGNKAIGNEQQGFLLDEGRRFTVFGNTAKKNGVGIALTDMAEDSTVVGNVALNNNGLVDLFDSNKDCDNNRWRFNWFRTSLTDPPDAGCIH